MVAVYRKCCSYEFCDEIARFYSAGKKRGSYCRHHAEDGMVDVLIKLCCHNLCTTTAIIDVEGSRTIANCKRHAQDGVANVRCKRFSYDSCNRRPSFNYDGRKTPVYCKQHAVKSPVNVQHHQYCSHHSCTKRPVWGLTTDWEATVCSHHNCDILGGAVLHFARQFKTDGRTKLSRWGGLKLSVC